MQHQVLEYYQVCSNDDLFYGKIKFGPYAFVSEKGKTMDFSETTIVYDVKVGRWS